MTNKDRLNQMFRILRKRGYLARQSFSCCGGCASYELGTMLKEEKNESKLGAVYYHKQDAERLRPRVRNGWRTSHLKGAESVYLGYGSRPEQEDDESCQQVGFAIVAAAGEAGLAVKWDGKAISRVEVMLPGGVGAEVE